MDYKLKGIRGRVWYYEGKWKRLDGSGAYMRVSDGLWSSLFGEESVEVVVTEAKPLVKVEKVVEVVPEVVVARVDVKRGRGRPRVEGVVGVRGMQKRRKRDGISRGVGRPRVEE